MGKNSKRERKQQVLSQYLPNCNSLYNCYSYGHIPRDKFYNACRSYAENMDYKDCIGLIDETLFGSGKKGMIFGVDGFYADSHRGIMLYKDGIRYNSLPSSYNITAVNEMLNKLYEIETEPTGWDIAGAIFDSSMNFLQSLSDNSEETTKGNETDNNCGEALSGLSETFSKINDALQTLADICDGTSNDEADEDEKETVRELMENALEHINRLQLHVNDALGGELEELLKELHEIGGILDEELNVDGIEVSCEAFIDSCVDMLLADEDVDDIEKLDLEKETNKIMENLVEDLSEFDNGDSDELEEKLKNSLVAYQKKLRKTRKVWMHLMEIQKAE
jgi:hypothetical protein